MEHAKKRTQINVRVDETELEKLRYSADTLGLSVGRYVKQVALAAPLVQPKLSPAIQQAVIRELAGVANNLNQLTRIANATGTMSQRQDLEQLREEVTKIWQQLEK
jgi:hypothetical protein